MRLGLANDTSRRSFLRGIFIFIIILTLPFYCLGFVLWALAPDTNVSQDVSPTATEGQQVPATFTPRPADVFTNVPPPTFTPRPVIFPTSIIPSFPTQITAVVPPPTIAPTNTFIPSFTPAPPSETPTVTNTLPPLLPPTDTPGP